MASTVTDRTWHGDCGGCILGTNDNFERLFRFGS